MKGVQPYGNFIASVKHGNPNQYKCLAQDELNNVAVILLSSGTTGLAKGVQLTEQNVMIGIAQHLYKKDHIC